MLNSMILHALFSLVLSTQTGACHLNPELIPLHTERHLAQGQDAHAIGGDLINLVILADSEQQIRQRFLAAQWSEPRLLKYLEDPWLDENNFPISRLYLWGRPQDLAFSRNTTLTLSHRNHLRLWKSPWSCQHKALWLGAASRDVGVERSRWGWHNGPTTHRIDPQVDHERDFVLNTLQNLGYHVEKISRSIPPQPLTGFNGNLDPYISDGRLGWIDLTQKATPHHAP